MVKENLIPIENKKPFETVQEIKNKVPSFEEFMKTYENDGSLNYDDLSGGSVGEAKGYGPCRYKQPWCKCSCDRGDYKSYHHFKQKNQQVRNPNYNPLIDDPKEEFLSSSSPAGGSIQNNPQQLSNSEIIEDVVREKNRVWRIDDVIIYQDGVKYLIKVLIKNSVQLEYDETGYPLFNSENMYQESRFNEEEKTVINQALGISQNTSSTSANHYQKQLDTEMTSPKTSNPNGSSLGTVALISGALVLAGVVIYAVVKSKKIKK